MDEWVKQNISPIELRSKENTYLIIDVWVRQFPKYLETIILYKNLDNNKYAIKYEGDTVKFSLMKILKNWKDISINFRKSKLHYSQTENIELNIYNSTQIGSDFNTYDNARNKAESYINSF